MLRIWRSCQALARDSSILRSLQFLPFAFLAVSLSSQQEHSERLLPGGPRHGLVAGELPYLLAFPLSTEPTSIRICVPEDSLCASVKAPV